MEAITSPLSGTDNVELIERIPTKLIIDLYDSKFNINVTRFFNKLEYIDIYKCLDTGYKFYYPLYIFGDDIFYEELQNSTSSKVTGDNYYPQWKWEYQIAYELISKNESVLDIGCGAGFFISKIKDRGSNVLGLEFNQKAIKSCLDKNIPVINTSIQEYAKSNSEQFDVITFFQVLEHIDNPMSFIEAALKVVKKGGKLIIGVPNNAPNYMYFNVFETLNLPPHHAGLWSESAFIGLTKLLPIRIEKMLKSPPPSFFHYQFYCAKSWLYKLAGIYKIKWWNFPLIIILAFLSIPYIIWLWLNKKQIGHTLLVVFEKTK